MQKVAVRVITENKFQYDEGLKELNLPTLKQRQENLTLKFAKKMFNKSNNQKHVCPHKKRTLDELKKH